MSNHKRPVTAAVDSTEDSVDARKSVSNPLGVAILIALVHVVTGLLTGPLMLLSFYKTAFGVLWHDADVLDFHGFWLVALLANLGFYAGVVCLAMRKWKTAFIVGTTAFILGVVAMGLAFDKPERTHLPEIAILVVLVNGITVGLIHSASDWEATLTIGMILAIVGAVGSIYNLLPFLSLCAIVWLTGLGLLTSVSWCRIAGDASPTKI